MNDRAEVINELWRRGDVIISEWKKKPFHLGFLNTRAHLDSILSPIGYPFSPIKYSMVKRYPWLVDEFHGAVMTNEEYHSDVYDEEMDNIREYVWDVIMPYYKLKDDFEIRCEYKKPYELYERNYED